MKIYPAIKHTLQDQMQVAGVIFLLFSVISFLSACQTQAPQQGTAIDEIDKTLQQGVDEAKRRQAARSTPADVSDALMPDVGIALPGTPDAAAVQQEQHFDISVSDAPAQEFFMSLVEGTPYNMVVHPNVSGSISLSLKDVTIPEVMAIARNVYGYEYTRTATSYQVLPVALQTRIFQVNYLNLSRKGESQTRVSSGQVTQSERALSRRGGGTTTTSSDEASGSKVKTESASDFWAELKMSLDAIVAGKEGRSVILSPNTGAVVVRAMPEELREVERFLNIIQNSAERQVIIEAKIIEVELKDGFQSGINWTALGRPGTGKTIQGGVSGGGSIFTGTGLTGTAGTNVTLQPGVAPYTAIIDTAFGGVFSLAANLNDFAAFIELLETQGNVQVLSSPRVSTVNNQKALIKVGVDRFFVTDISTTTVTGSTSSTSNPNVTLTPFFSGIALDVLPQINDEGDVILHIHPTVSEVTEENKSIGLTSTSTITIPLAVSSIRESDTIIRARSGQIVVIGGLMQNTTREEVGGVPLLSDLPFVGSLFRHTKQSSKKSELVILLRPIVVGESTWQTQLENSRGKIKKLRRGFHYGGKQEVFGTEAEVKR
ncbi:MAG: pilus (MSHA type) biogenesis protein MshL [Gammaproteobacteria bacterium]|nr:MAG: pilus (MSHA type) biogenesis protein MshL [Gammaproteobacteria bacterium]